MIINYEYGISFNGFIYGWKDKKLFRLPQTINKRFLPIKELKIIKVGNNKGYLLNQKRLSLSQLESMTGIINFKYEKTNSKDCPF